MSDLQSKPLLIGPFSQILSMDSLPEAGPISDESLEVLDDAWLLIEEGKILNVGNYDELSSPDQEFFELDFDAVLTPGFIDCHTHICFAGSRASDYAKRLNGKSYLEIAKEGGGILDSVSKLRKASKQSLFEDTLLRVMRHVDDGVTSCEIKSGYGLSLDAEIKMLEVIRDCNQEGFADLIPTCLALHVLPKEFKKAEDYIELVENEIMPKVKSLGLAKRMDVYIEKGAFNPQNCEGFLRKAQGQGFDIVIHADQFSPGGAKFAAKIAALSADHLEASGAEDIAALKKGKVIPVALPGASLGLGEPFAPARKILDEGMALAIASDWNPGSAPSGDLVMQEAVLGAHQDLSMAETLSGITFRAARALRLFDRGVIKKGNLADFCIYPCSDFREILYNQGSLKPSLVFKSGVLVGGQENQFMETE